MFAFLFLEKGGESVKPRLALTDIYSVPRNKGSPKFRAAYERKQLIVRLIKTNDLRKSGVLTRTTDNRADKASGLPTFNCEHVLRSTERAPPHRTSYKFLSRAYIPAATTKLISPAVINLSSTTGRRTCLSSREKRSLRDFVSLRRNDRSQPT